MDYYRGAGSSKPGGSRKGKYCNDYGTGNIGCDQVIVDGKKHASGNRNCYNAHPPPPPGWTMEQWLQYLKWQAPGTAG